MSDRSETGSQAEGAFHDQVEQLLFECLEQPPALRARALEERCGVRPELAGRLRARFQRIEQLGLVAEDLPPPEAPPERFGRYRILRSLGSGGMGVVYLAEDPTLGRRVALKLIRIEHLPFARARERFRREALLASRLDHPCICTVHDAGEIDGTPFLAMRYIEGGTLDARLRRARAGGDAAVVVEGLAPPPGTETGGRALRPAARRGGQDALLGMFERLALALHAAHEAGLVHRDVKPGNVMVTQSGNPVLLDFGLALDERAEDGLTLSGDRLGTPAYMAPEQVRGGASDRRADVYGLAATLYECLTLRCPFVAGSREDLYRLILTAEPPDPRKLDPRIGRDLCAVLEKALEKDPDRRYATAADFAEELRRVRANAPVLARRAGTVQRTRRWCQRNPMATALVAVLVVASVGSWFLLLEGQRALRQANAATFASFAREVGESDAMLGLLTALEAHDLAAGPDTTSAVLDSLVRSHEVRRFDRHTDAVWRVVFSADQTKVISAGLDGAVCIQDLRGARAPVVLQHGGNVYDVDVHKDRIVSASRDDRSVRLWDSTGRQIVKAPIPERPGELANMFLRARFSHDGTKVLALSQGGPAWIWEPASGDVIELVGHRGMVFHGEFSPDDRFIATCVGWGTDIIPPNGECTARIWRVSDGKQVAVCEGHEKPLLWVEFAPDGKSLVTASLDGTVRIWDLEGRELKKLTGHRAGVRVARFHPHGRGLIASGSFDGDLRLWTTTGEVIAVMPQGEPIWDLEFSPDGERLLSASYGRMARIHDLRGRCLRVLRGHADKVMDATFSADGRLVVTGSWDHSVRLWRAEDDECRVLAAHAGAIRSLDCAGDGRFVSASADGTACVWHQGRSRVLDAGFRMNRARFSPSGDCVLTAQDDQTVLLWSTGGERLGRWKATEQRLFAEGLSGWRNCTVAFVGEDRFLSAAQTHELRLHDRSGQSAQIVAPSTTYQVPEIADLCAHADGRRFATAHLDGTVKLWDLHGHVLSTHGAHRAQVVCVEFSHDGTRLLSASKDGTLILWQLRGDELCHALTLAHSAGLTGATFAPPSDSHILATAMDGTAHLWTSGGAGIATMRLADVPLTCAAFRPDGRSFLVGTEHGLVLSCPMPDEAVALARQRARPLRADERQRIERRSAR